MFSMTTEHFEGKKKKQKLPVHTVTEQYAIYLHIFTD